MTTSDDKPDATLTGNTDRDTDSSAPASTDSDAGASTDPNASDPFHDFSVPQDADFTSTETEEPDDTDGQ
ncbi:hypothetical protein [Subtercola sp. YIM 133946]|uniref:hypothetical protein n=1 Tax=Subtercola sp. YIM 133946 TaxID=3118909 RepID=UPI002F91D99C